ncbi:MAG: flavodoxin family protein [Desulfarculaceae bacterium]|nr:flavodoxin family protein [Desulfarculaceae bacterium]MCF8071100.1 flavodoxin family protein [Desulfarculaceae bacterium]MCF8100688.1 flavodoxin family protein [Desulfarculaceae bacterium]MCF8118172.1 flavodoxin family protein [Desulfarculaceae bacterium]
MKVLAINGTYRQDQTTSRLTAKALEGAAAQGAETEMVLLKDLDIGYCTNCLTCYKDHDSEIASCVLQDDVRSVLEKIRAADGVIFASPLHNGFVTGLMTAFIERCVWTLNKPTAEMLGLKGCPEPRLRAKPRAVATIISAGLMPAELRQYCDTATPWLMETASLMCNAMPGQDMYAAAVFGKQLSDQEWKEAYFHRELQDEQFQEAHDLGANMAGAIAAGEVQPYDFEAIMAMMQGQSQ